MVLKHKGDYWKLEKKERTLKETGNPILNKDTSDKLLLYKTPGSSVSRTIGEPLIREILYTAIQTELIMIFQIRSEDPE